ncbi:OmpA family protein [Nonlabens antarcticus]|uniref:OmpA family protein n=1 Tax=Nonlabens antarcticus TaxID=392714 RepID=UPI0018916CEC|nr:OmpA family protein [Nonlabens antarcticus]
MKKLALVALTALMAVSCASKKDLESALEKQKRTQELLDTATVELNACLSDKKVSYAQLEAMRSQVADLRANNEGLISNTGDLTMLSKKGADNLEKSLESLREKDLQIRTLNDAITRKDSVTLALVQSFKGVLGNLNDEDISINVEKGVVYVSISDKLLFASGSATINSAAKSVLGKVAKVVNDKPEIEIMVEGHTDNQSINTPLFKDNWALSSARAASVTRLLQTDFNVDPARMTAAGRSYYIPVASNDTAAGRAKNRRTRIIVLPKLDQFFDIVEKGMEEAKAKAKAGE